MKRAWMIVLFCTALAAALAPAPAGAEVTEEWGVDRRGSDYRSFRASDLAQCQQACEDDRSCRAYTFTVGGNTCYLKSGPGSAQRRDGRVSGVKVAAAPAPAPSQGYSGRALTEEWGYDYAGNDYRRFQTPTLAECKVTCREEERCRAYTFNHHSQTCYLKEATGNRVTGDLHVTGTKDARGTPPSGVQPTEERGYDYPGNDYHTFKVESLEYCKSACREEERCRAYSFNTRSNMCHLKDRTGGRGTNPNTIAGTKGGSPPPAADQPIPGQPSSGLTEEWGYDYRGNDYRDFRARGHEPCKLTCQGDSRCRAYTFNQRTEICYLKDAVGYRDSNRDTITGRKQ